LGILFVYAIKRAEWINAALAPSGIDPSPGGEIFGY
jgi:hypothetical protein